MKIGFTGSREGMTDAQKSSTIKFLCGVGATEGHHGDCVGGDADFHQICKDLRIPIVIHPPTEERLRAFCESDEIREAKGYIERNRAIVNETHILVACPKENHVPETVFGRGTWSTVRYAINKGRRTYTIWPSGDIVLSTDRPLERG